VGRRGEVVKASNTVDFNIMADPRFEGGRAAMFYWGDDATAAVASLISELGFEALDAGPLTQCASWSLSPSYGSRSPSNTVTGARSPFNSAAEELTMGIA